MFKISEEKKSEYIIKLWVFCLFASIVSFIFMQLYMAFIFVWIATCISCGSVSWYIWFSKIVDDVYNKREVALGKCLKPNTKIILDNNQCENIENIIPGMTLKGAYSNVKVVSKIEHKELIEKREIIDCSCKCDSILAYTDNDFLNGDVELSFWKYGHSGKVSLKNKIRNVWQIIREGHPYSDMVILDKDGVNKMIKFLQEAKEIGKSESKKIEVDQLNPLQTLNNIQNSMNKKEKVIEIAVGALSLINMLGVSASNNDKEKIDIANKALLKISEIVDPSFRE